MGFWHASDDIVAGVRQVPRDLPSPPRGQNLSGSGALALSLSPPRTGSLSNKCPSRVLFGREDLADRASRQGTDEQTMNECRTGGHPEWFPGGFPGAREIAGTA